MNTRYEKGLATFEKMMGQGKGREIVDAFGEICPDLVNFTMEWAFNDVYNRPGLDLKNREMIPISSLVTQGSAIPQLKAHVEAALNVGVSQEELVELILQLGLYCGFPKAINGMLAAKEVFAERR